MGLVFNLIRTLIILCQLIGSIFNAFGLIGQKNAVTVYTVNGAKFPHLPSNQAACPLDIYGMILLF